MIELSIIIPVYNAEKYLKNTIDSIFKADKESIELILVDDGSTDSSYKIMQNYAERYSHIKAYKKTNGGAASARNYGLDKSLGRFISFVDADDYIDLIKFDAAFDKIRKSSCDMLFSSIQFNRNGIVQVGELYPDAELFGNDRILSAISALNKFPGSSCSKIYRKKFLDQNNIRFSEGIVNEDIKFVIDCLLKTDHLMLDSEKWYFYRQNVSGSVTNSGSKGALRTCSDMLAIVTQYRECKDDKIRYSLYRILAYEISTLYIYFGRMEKADRIYIKKTFKKNIDLLKYRNTREKIIYYLTRSLGFTLTSSIISAGYYFKQFYAYKKMNNKM